MSHIPGDVTLHSHEDTWEVVPPVHGLRQRLKEGDHSGSLISLSLKTVIEHCGGKYYLLRDGCKLKNLGAPICLCCITIKCFPQKKKKKKIVFTRQA